MSLRLHVGNLHREIDDAALKQLFAPAGSVVMAHVVRSIATGASTGRAFVEMVSEKQGAVAIELNNARAVLGQMMTVREASYRDECDAKRGQGPAQVASDPDLS